MKKRKGFTLIEMVLYLSVFVLILSLATIKTSISPELRFQNEVSKLNSRLREAITYSMNNKGKKDAKITNIYLFFFNTEEYTEYSFLYPDKTLVYRLPKKYKIIHNQPGRYFLINVRRDGTPKNSGTFFIVDTKNKLKTKFTICAGSSRILSWKVRY